MFFSLRFLMIFILIFLLIIQSSCNRQYYQTNTSYKIDIDTIEKLIVEKKVFIIHTPSQVFLLKNVVTANKTILGEKFTLEPQYYEFVHPKFGKINAAPRAKDAINITNSQVHLYTNYSFYGIDDINLPMNQITRMDIYGVDLICTRNHKTRITLLIIAGTIIYAGLLVFYISNGSEL
jgi:hypothetical protein